MLNKFRLYAQRESELVVLLATAVILITLLASVMSSQFFSAGNLQSMAVQLSAFGFLALAMAISMLSGGIDLSIVAAMVLSGIAGAYVVSGKLIAVTDTNGATLALLALVVAVLVGLACGTLNGFLISKISIPPILATLSTMILFSGIGMALTNGQSVAVVVPEVATFANAAVAGIPVIFLMLVVAFVLVGFFLSKFSFGRRLYLFGENQVALRFAGGRTERTIWLSYVLVGLLVGLAAVILVARVNSARTGIGESYLLQAILVVVLAGVNPFGGKGRITMLAVALMLLQFISSALNVLGWSPYLRNFVWGAMLISVMIANFYLKRWAKRSSLNSHNPPAAPQPAVPLTPEAA